MNRVETPLAVRRLVDDRHGRIRIVVRAVIVLKLIVAALILAVFIASVIAGAQVSAALGADD